MKELSSKEVRTLKAQGAHLEAVTVIGKRGITEQNTQLIELALQKDSLIKVSIRPNAFEDRKQAAKDIAAKFQAQLIKQIGSAILLYRLADED